MAETTKIEWADATFNPWIGCTRISPACDHCYAAVSTAARSTAARLGIESLWDGKQRHRTSELNWKEPLKWDREAGKAGMRKRVFCASLADVFDNAVPPSWRSDLFHLIEHTPNLDWLLLTKRIGNAREMTRGVSSWPNVWLGATVVNQEEADRDIPKLLATPAAKRFLSIEPMLGPIDLTKVCDRSRPRGLWMNTLQAREDNDAHSALVQQFGPNYPYARLDWVIVGGESGTGSRQMHPDWVRGIRNQCARNGVPFLFKQWGEFAPAIISRRQFLEPQPENEGELVAVEGGSFGMYPHADPLVVMRRIGKKHSGRELDGTTHTEFPR